MVVMRCAITIRICLLPRNLVRKKGATCAGSLECTWTKHWSTTSSSGARACPRTHINRKHAHKHARVCKHTNIQRKREREREKRGEGTFAWTARVQREHKAKVSVQMNEDKTSERKNDWRHHCYRRQTGVNCSTCQTTCTCLHQRSCR